MSALMSSVFCFESQMQRYFNPCHRENKQRAGFLIPLSETLQEVQSFVARNINPSTTVRLQRQLQISPFRSS